MVGWLVLAFVLLAAATGLYLQRRKRRSRLLDPDALRLDPGNSAHLLGSEAEIEDLVRTCDAAPLVFLSGQLRRRQVRADPRRPGSQAARRRALAADPPRHGRRDFDRGLASALGEAFWRTLSEAERTQLGCASFPRPHRALKALRTSHRATGRRPLVLLDQIDDYQLRHHERFLTAELHTWQPTSATLAASRFWRWIAAVLERRQLGTMLVTRSDNHSALESLRLVPDPKSYPLGPLPSAMSCPSSTG